jgi:hypothetical protein
MEGGSLHDGTSQISREVHVRFCERLGAKVPGPTWRQRGPATFAHASLGPLRDSGKRWWRRAGVRC